MFVIVDVEATCDAGLARTIGNHNCEIIELPFLVFDSQRRAVVEERQSFVKPLHTGITDFCTRLTGITKEKLDAEGKTLQEVVTDLEDMLDRLRIADSATLLCDGRWDMFVLQKEFLSKSIALRYPQFWRRFFDLKQEFRKHYPVEKYPDSAYHPVPSLKFMARYCRAKNTDLTAHIGLHDCQLEARIVAKLLEDNHVFDAPCTLPDDYDPRNDSQVKDFNDYLDPDVPVSPEKVLSMMDFDASNVEAVIRVNHIPCGSDAFKVLVLLKSYTAQTFLQRGNVGGLCFSVEHFHSLVRRNVPSIAACAWLSDHDAFVSARKYVNGHSIVKHLEDFSVRILSEVSGLHYGGKLDAVRFKLQQLASELHCGRLLVETMACVSPTEPSLAKDDAAHRQRHEKLRKKLEYGVPFEINVADSADYVQSIIDGMRQSLALASRLTKNPTWSIEQLVHHHAPVLGVNVSEELLAKEDCLTLTCADTAPDIVRKSMWYFKSLVVLRPSLEVLAGVSPLSTNEINNGDASKGKGKNDRKKRGNNNNNNNNNNNSNEATVMVELLDGIPCTLFWNLDHWVAVSVPSSGSFPNMNVNCGNDSLRSDVVVAKFWQLWKDKGYKFPDENAAGSSFFTFRLISPGIPGVLVLHEREDLVFELCFSRDECEVDVSFDCANLGWARARTLESIPPDCVPTDFRGAITLRGTSERDLIETEPYQHLALAVAQTRSPKALDALVSLALRFRIGTAWFSRCKHLSRLSSTYESLYNYVSSLVDRVQEQFDAAGGIRAPKDAFRAHVASSPDALALTQMKDTGVQNALTFFRNKHPSIITKQWKKEQRAVLNKSDVDDE